MPRTPFATLEFGLSDQPLTPAEQAEVLDLAVAIKAAPFEHRPLEGPRTVALVFDRPTLRTQVSFSAGIAELGGHAMTVDGGLAAMTLSNGSCSGVFLPGTGIQLNNVMGEADLHPRGFHSTPAGTRIGSMMAPTLLRTSDGTRTATPSARVSPSRASGASSSWQRSTTAAPAAWAAPTTVRRPSRTSCTGTERRLP